MVITKDNHKSRVHRPAYLDYLGIRMLDRAGNVIGERRFLGLFASTAYSEAVGRIPLLRQKSQEVLRRSQYDESSHGGKAIIDVLDTYPRDELFQAPVAELARAVEKVAHLKERRQVRLFVRRDAYGRYLSCLVYLPRDRYTTAVRNQMQDILLDRLGGEHRLHGPGDRVGAGPAALRGAMPDGSALADVDVRSLERELTLATRSWNDEFAEMLSGAQHPDELATLVGALPEGYKEDYQPHQAVLDLTALLRLSDDDDDRHGHVPAGSSRRRRRPAVQDLALVGDAVAVQDHAAPVAARRRRRRRAAVRAGRRPGPARLRLRLRRHRPRWSGGGREALGHGGAGAVHGGVRRLVRRSQRTGPLQRAGDGRRPRLARGRHPASHRPLCAPVRLDLLPDLRRAGAHRQRGDRPAAGRAVRDQVRPAAGAVQGRPGRRGRGPAREDQAGPGLGGEPRPRQDHPPYLAIIDAVIRTSFYQPGRDTIAFKLLPRKIIDLPQPRPAYEIFVYSPRVEGVHLRFGSVARGGLRWSDRAEDFRTEVLGLVKAQMVKNTVIVPVGAKGGFYCKQLPDPSVDREAWLNEGKACYRLFISSLLDITDNIVDGGVVPPSDVVRYDGDDPYLVVAADKGTATFSDIANAISIDHGFWLGDAFASGGSAGYDHKGMGITARGAWESVQRHFREMGIDPQTTDFTCVGIGDMSGDVFGNGMLLSEHIKLVAAFDHRHVVIDPDPDPAATWRERQRLFDLPRSSWADYDTTLISAGGGVFPRTLKSIVITPEMRTALGIAEGVAELAPAELISACLRAPVDLLWNGGIGTYVKATAESHAQVGDKANDGLRVNGAEMRARAVGEGGNLGLTQLGRIEYAMRGGESGKGGRINTDFIDNSAGVDTSDHEVNIKILLAGEVTAGRLTGPERDELLASMTDEVGRLVLKHNYDQNLALANAVYQSASMAGVHEDWMERLEDRGMLDREIEFLPTTEEMVERRRDHRGLSSPELSTLMSYTKIMLAREVLSSDLPDDPHLADRLVRYFPTPLRERYGEAIREHRLSREIITTVLVNDFVNKAGITCLHRLSAETGASVADLIRANVAARTIFGAADTEAAIVALDHQIPASAQTDLRIEVRTLVERATRWLVNNRRRPIDISAAEDFYAKPVADLMDAAEPADRPGRGGVRQGPEAVHRRRGARGPGHPGGGAAVPVRGPDHRADRRSGPGRGGGGGQRALHARPTTGPGPAAGPDHRAAPHGSLGDHGPGCAPRRSARRAGRSDRRGDGPRPSEGRWVHQAASQRLGEVDHGSPGLDQDAAVDLRREAGPRQGVGGAAGDARAAAAAELTAFVSVGC